MSRGVLLKFQKPSGRRVFCLWAALARPLQPAAGMRRPRRLAHSHRGLTKWLHTNRRRAFSPDVQGSLDAGFAASARLRWRWVNFNVS